MGPLGLDPIHQRAQSENRDPIIAFTIENYIILEVQNFLKL